jgi:16S rRNA processing protein RimM
MGQIKSGKENYLRLGECRRPQGLKGGCHFQSPSGQETTLRPGTQVFIKPLKTAEFSNSHDFVALVLRDVWLQTNPPVLFFESISDRTTLERYLPFEVWIEEAQLPQLLDHQFYLKDLQDMRCFDEQEKEWGRVLQFYEQPAQVILSIQTLTGDIVDVPFVDAFIKKVDVTQKRMTILRPEWIE